MKNSVWADARRRARDETLELVRLNDPIRALLTFGVPLATIGLFWFISGQWAFATAIGLSSTLCIGILIYLAKLVIAPAKLAEEARSKLSEETLEAEQAQRSRRHSVINKLVGLYCLESGDSAPAPIRAGLELPPEDWLNEHLANLGEVWTIFNINGTDYQTFEIVTGEWRYRDRRLNSPASVKWAAFFDGLDISWDLGKGYFDVIAHVVGVDGFMRERTGL